jgi:hypothetical protein
LIDAFRVERSIARVDERPEVMLDFLIIAKLADR